MAEYVFTASREAEANRLAKWLENDLPGKDFVTRQTGTTLTVVTRDGDWSAGEQTTLASTINARKDGDPVTDWPA